MNMPHSISSSSPANQGLQQLEPWALPLAMLEENQRGQRSVEEARALIVHLQGLDLNPVLKYQSVLGFVYPRTLSPRIVARIVILYGEDSGSGSPSQILCCLQGYLANYNRHGTSWI